MPKPGGTIVRSGVYFLLSVIATRARSKKLPINPKPSVPYMMIQNPNLANEKRNKPKPPCYMQNELLKEKSL
jgi:hypothetical protein